MSGLDLARDGQDLLWFVPVLMGALVLSAIIRIRREEHRAFALASAISGLLTAYLMNREQLRVYDESGLIKSQLTGWFCLALFDFAGCHLWNLNAVKETARALALKKDR